MKKEKPRKCNKCKIESLYMPLSTSRHLCELCLDKWEKIVSKRLSSKYKKKEWELLFDSFLNE